MNACRGEDGPDLAADARLTASCANLEGRRAPYIVRGRGPTAGTGAQHERKGAAGTGTAVLKSSVSYHGRAVHVASSMSCGAGVRSLGSRTNAEVLGTDMSVSMGEIRVEANRPRTPPTVSGRTEENSIFCLIANWTKSSKAVS